MFVSGSAAPISRASSLRAGVILGEAVDASARARRAPRRRGCPPCAPSPPPRRFRCTRAAAIVSASPARIVPNGAQRPLLRLSATVSTGAASSASGTPSATAAFASRAPSRCDRGAVRRERRGLRRRRARCRRAACACSRGRSRPPSGLVERRPARGARPPSSQSPSFTRMCASARSGDAAARAA